MSLNRGATGRPAVELSTNLHKVSQRLLALSQIKSIRHDTKRTFNILSRLEIGTCLNMLNAHFAECLYRFLNLKALIAALKKKQALMSVGPSPGIVKSCQLLHCRNYSSEIFAKVGCQLYPAAAWLSGLGTAASRPLHRYCRQLQPDSSTIQL